MLPQKQVQREQLLTTGFFQLHCKTSFNFKFSYQPSN